MERTLMHPRSQSGFALMAAVFLIVVLAMAALFMMRMSSVVNTQQGQLVLAQRVKQAALGGIEFGIYQASQGACNASTALAIPVYDNMAITVGCTQNSFVDGNSVLNIVTVTSTASYGTPADADHITRQFDVQLRF